MLGLVAPRTVLRPEQYRVHPFGIKVYSDVLGYVGAPFVKCMKLTRLNTPRNSNVNAAWLMTLQCTT